MNVLSHIYYSKMNFSEQDRLVLAGNLNNFLNRSSRILSEEDILGDPLSKTYECILGIQGFVIILANLLTIISVCRYEFLWEDCSSRFILSLACSDLLAGIRAFVEISRMTTRIDGSLWSSLCYIELYLWLVSSCGNYYNILLVALDRYISITRPLRYHAIVTPFRTTIAIVVVWCVIIGENILQIVFAIYGTIDGICTLRAALPAFFLNVFLLTAIVVPCYVKIIFTVRRLKKSEPHLTCFPAESQTQQREKLKQRKMTKTMAYVLGPFLLCFYSTLIYNAVISNLYKPPLPFGILLIRKISIIVFWVQSLINPFVYGWHNQSFKKAYRKLHAELKAFIFQLPIRPQSDWKVLGRIIELGKFSERFTDSGSKPSDRHSQTLSSLDEVLPLQQLSGQATSNFKPVFQEKIAVGPNDLHFEGPKARV